VQLLLDFDVLEVSRSFAFQLRHKRVPLILGTLSGERHCCISRAVCAAMK
jgi:hypothetical protein